MGRNRVRPACGVLTDKQRAKRIDKLRQKTEALRNDPTAPRKFFWLSFADGKFLGGCLVDDVVDFFDALEKTHRLGINPGGAVQGIEVPPELIPHGHPLNCLLSKADIDAIDRNRVN
jgi:hypothetical protein